MDQVLAFILIFNFGVCHGAIRFLVLSTNLPFDWLKKTDFLSKIRHVVSFGETLRLMNE